MQSLRPVRRVAELGSFGFDVNPYWQIIAGGSLVAVFIGCSHSRLSSAGDLRKWQNLSEPIENVRVKSKNDAILVAFTADWNASAGPMFRQALQDPAVISFLGKRSVDCFVADLTETNSPGWHIIERHGADAVPISIAIWKRGGHVKFVRPEPTAQGIITALARHIQ